MQVVGFQGRCLVNSFYRGVPMPFQPEKDERSLAVFVRGGKALMGELEVHELRSAWVARPYEQKAAAGVAPTRTTASKHPAEGSITPFLGDPRFEMQPLFATNRFPNVVVAMDGSILAFWNGVKLRRSKDGGRTWKE